MLKRIPLIFLAFLLAFSSAGCAEVAENSSAQNITSTTSVVESTPEDDKAEEINVPEISETEESRPESSASSSKASSATVSKASEPEKTVSEPVKKSSDFKYNTNLDINDNVFMDALIYTGYNITKHRNDGNMWVYILANQKKGLGYLSNITYGGGCMGYETKNGKPDLAAFQRGGLVCASYVTYVYFNYLPNVAGIDTSSLTTPGNSHLAHDWYLAAKDWVKKGYSKQIPFTATLGGANHTVFKSSASIPIGSVVVFKEFSQRNNPKSEHGSHVCIYAGYKNGYNWVFHVGNKNGPEFCAIERMSCGHDPQWPLAVFATPSNIRFSAKLEVKVTDEDGSPVKGASFKLKNKKTNTEISVGTTGENGVINKEGLKYGDYILVETVPAGYTADVTEQNVSLTTASNSEKIITIKNKKQINETQTEEKIVE